MANEPTGGSTAHKSNEWCRYLREKKGLISTMPSEARNFTAIADHIATLTADNERLSARVARLEAALKPLLAAANGLSFGEDWNNGTQAKLHGYRQKLIDAIPAARRELEESHD